VITLISSDAKPVAAIAITLNGVKTIQRLPAHLNVKLWIPASLTPHVTPLPAQCEVYHTPLRDLVAELWTCHDAMIFTLATGAVVRLIAPLLSQKAHDPAVIAINDCGNFVISLCGGHQQGADRLSQELAHYLNAQAVITGASSGLGLPGIDTLGLPFGWTRGRGNWTGVSGAIARQEPVQVIQETGSELWQKHLPYHHSFQFGWPDMGGESSASSPPSSPARARLWISAIQRRFSDTDGIPKAQWHPRVLWIGVGCERGTSREVIESGIQQACQSAHFAEGAIAGIATIDLKADEVGIVELCGDRQWPLRCFSASHLNTVTVPTPSNIVYEEVGTASVAEAAALLAAASPMSTLGNHVDSHAPDNLTAQTSLEDARLQVSKQIFRLDGHPGAVTVAIAQASREYTGRSGQLFLVGTGPGAIEHMTPAAQGAISRADAVIGYGLYIDLVSALLRPGQIVETFDITQERQRAERAIQLADWGLTVAVISSGDSGIYGMAGLVMESLQHQRWDGERPQVAIFPGVSALQAAASRVGTPLMHDFCSVSLSDLMTPWAVIEKRLEAAAQADFVTALYNPKSKKRTEHVAIAQSIFLKYKSPQTPVAIVQSAYRHNEQVTLSTLEHFLDTNIDMLTIILIGNASTCQHHHWLITPRGYMGNNVKS
jgi:cobalt-precorrin 5A hydrolase/precorrin-3B C17-methyltransferase